MNLFWSYFRDSLRFPLIRNLGPLAMLVEGAAVTLDEVRELIIALRDQTQPLRCNDAMLLRFAASRGITRSPNEPELYWLERVRFAYDWWCKGGRSSLLSKSLVDGFNVASAKIINMRREDPTQWASFRLEIDGASGDLLTRLNQIDWAVNEVKPARSKLKHTSLFVSKSDILPFWAGVVLFGETVTHFSGEDFMYVNFKGAFVPGDYNVNDCFRHNGAIWRAKADNSVAPPVDFVDNEHWELLLPPGQKGDKGDTGNIGAQGASGPPGAPGNPYKTYGTLVLATADLANIPDDRLVWINNDTVNTGYYSKLGGVLVKSDSDRVALVEGRATTLESRATIIENGKAPKSYGKNLFNINDADVAVGYYLAIATGALVPTSDFATTGYIPVVAGTTYYLSVKYYIVWYDINKTRISGFDIRASSNTQIAPAGACFMRCTIYPYLTGTLWTKFQVEVSAVGTTWEAYLDQSMLASKAIAMATRDNELDAKKAQIARGKNLVNINAPDVLLNSYINAANGNITFENNNYALTGYIPITGGATYTFSSQHRMCWFTADKIYISGVTIGGGNTLVAPANAVYARVSVTPWSTGTLWTKLQVEEGSAATAWEAYTDQSMLPGRAAALELRATALETSKANIIPGKNKFNINDPDIALNQYVSEANGNLGGFSGYATTGYIPVVAGTTYVVSTKKYLAWYNASKIFISGSPATDANRVQTAPAGAAYLRCSVYPYNTGTLWTEFQVEIGTASTAFEAYYTGVDLSTAIKGTLSADAIPDGLITIPKANFFSVGKNKFNINDSGNVTAKYINSTTGNADPNDSYNATGYIPVTGGATYTLSTKSWLAWYTAAHVYISGSSSSDTNPTQSAPANAAYLRTSVLITGGTQDWLQLQVELGTNKTAWESYGYQLSDPTGGLPIRTAVVSPTSNLAIAPKLYTAVGKEIAVYQETVAGIWPSLQGRIGITLTGSKMTGPSTKLTPASTAGSPLAISVTLANESMDIIETKSSSLIIASEVTTTAVVVQNIGDSITFRSTFTDAIKAGASATGLTFTGIRDSSTALVQVPCEGYGGWTLAMHSTVDSSGLFSPFMHPVTAGYRYFGKTSYWIAANGASPAYAYANFNRVKTLFNPATGLLTAPAVNDIMGNGAGAYVVWNGSSWVTILSAAFGGFELSYAKYRATWGIARPNIVHVLLGTNDFYGKPPAGFPAVYATFKSQYDALIASIHADSPSCKIIIGIPPSSGRQGDFGIYASELCKRDYFLLAQSLIADYSNREGELLYLADYHSILDREFAWGNASEPPFTGYTGSNADGLYKADLVHPLDGAVQMANLYMGIIQALR
jgi:hypothetical protein